VLEHGALEQALESLVHGLTAGTPIKRQCTIEETGQGTEVTAIVPLGIDMLSNTTESIIKMHHEPETTDSHLDCR
jgi:hypothetical protein